MSAFLLKTFTEELTSAWQRLFHLSVDARSVPELWKKSIIVPVPKRACAQEDNDCWPVAPTTDVMKALERLITEELLMEVELYLDHYQFAYTKKKNIAQVMSSQQLCILS